MKRNLISVFLAACAFAMVGFALMAIITSSYSTSDKWWQAAGVMFLVTGVVTPICGAAGMFE